MINNFKLYPSSLWRYRTWECSTYISSAVACISAVSPFVWPRARRSMPCPTKSSPSRSHSLPSQVGLDPHFCPLPHLPFFSASFMPAFQLILPPYFSPLTIPRPPPLISIRDSPFVTLGSQFYPSEPHLPPHLFILLFASSSPPRSMSVEPWGTPGTTSRGYPSEGRWWQWKLSVCGDKG